MIPKESSKSVEFALKMQINEEIRQMLSILPLNFPVCMQDLIEIYSQEDNENKQT